LVDTLAYIRNIYLIIGGVDMSGAGAGRGAGEPKLSKIELHKAESLKPGYQQEWLKSDMRAGQQALRAVGPGGAVAIIRGVRKDSEGNVVRVRKVVEVPKGAMRMPVAMMPDLLRLRGGGGAGVGLMAAGVGPLSEIEKRNRELRKELLQDLKSNTDVSKKRYGSRSWSALHVIASSKNYDRYQEGLEKIAGSLPAMVKSTDKAGRTPLMVAKQYGDLAAFIEIPQVAKAFAAKSSTNQHAAGGHTELYDPSESQPAGAAADDLLMMQPDEEDPLMNPPEVAEPVMLGELVSSGPVESAVSAATPSVAEKPKSSGNSQGAGAGAGAAASSAATPFWQKEYNHLKSVLQTLGGDPAAKNVADAESENVHRLG